MEVVFYIQICTLYIISSEHINDNSRSITLPPVLSFTSNAYVMTRVKPRVKPILLVAIASVPLVWRCRSSTERKSQATLDTYTLFCSKGMCSKYLLGGADAVNKPAHVASSHGDEATGARCMMHNVTSTIDI